MQKDLSSCWSINKILLVCTPLSRLCTRIGVVWAHECLWNDQKWPLTNRDHRHFNLLSFLSDQINYIKWLLTLQCIISGYHCPIWFVIEAIIRAISCFLKNFVINTCIFLYSCQYLMSLIWLTKLLGVHIQIFLIFGIFTQFSLSDWFSAAAKAIF